MATYLANNFRSYGKSTVELRLYADASKRFDMKDMT